MKTRKLEKEKATQNEPLVENDIKFSKEQLINAKIYQDNKDLLNALLDNNRLYTLVEVDKLIKNFMKGKVS